MINSEIPKPEGNEWIYSATYTESLKAIIRESNFRMLQLRKWAEENQKK